MFPSILPQEANVPRPSSGAPRTGFVTAHANDVDGTRWKSLVGDSGCKYTLNLMMDDLLSCWPVLDGDTEKAPITVIHLVDGSISQSYVTENRMRQSLIPLDMMFQLYYTKPQQRCIKLPVAEYQLDTDQMVYVRNCWDVFVRGVIEKITKLYKLTPPTHDPNPNFPLLPENGEPPDELSQEEIDAIPPELRASVQQSPNWTEDSQLMREFESAFSQDFVTLNSFEGESDEEKAQRQIKNVFLKGTPGTGKSQMLLYLIYRLMHSFEKVTILYIPFQLSKVVTILIDHTNPTTPINVRVHNSKFEEYKFIRGSGPVIRILDSENPFKESRVSVFFTVFAASPKIYKDYATGMSHADPYIEPRYPPWGKDEFLTMMVRLGKTDSEYWHHNLRVQQISEMQPLVVTFLGAHGQCIPKNGQEAAYVKKNVIDVFGLTPRMLGNRVGTAFLELIKALPINSLLTDDEYTLPTISHLTFNGISKSPISSFAARLFTELETLKSAHFLELVHNRELEERLREQMFKSKVNDELLVSHVKLTVYSAMPNGFRSFKFHLPVIRHDHKTEDELLSLEPSVFEIESNVLYSRPTNEAGTQPNNNLWTGFDSFVYLQEQTSSEREVSPTIHTLYTFKTTLSETSNACNTVLIDAIREKMARQKKLEREDINVFFIWIVLSEHVGSFRNQVQPEALSTRYHFNTGVVSVSDLLTESSDCSGIPEMDDLWGRDMTQFDPTSDAFIDCFTEPTFSPPLPTLDRSIVREPASTINFNLSEFVATLENTHLSNLQPSSIQSGQLNCF
ncbi:hypothetical protein BLNAU_8336 [Blattamonas nauphoetae]|uniref:Uncharacterized protein n=1 Tax=Blattamonas nauphoetae TaxID=2049346 RepID=A0ABQ9XYY2_9EUKA|nr:hypothetical protein BLNAU_8336 [Blattamonas nauphoetae]